MVAQTANPMEGKQQLDGTGINRTTPAVNTFRLKVQRRLLMICTGLKQSACLRSQGAKYLTFTLLPLKELLVHLREWTRKTSGWIWWVDEILPNHVPLPF